MLLTLKSQWHDELFNWVNSLFNTDRVFPSWEVLKPESAGCQASTLPRLSVLGWIALICFFWKVTRGSQVRERFCRIGFVCSDDATVEWTSSKFRHYQIVNLWKLFDIKSKTYKLTDLQRPFPYPVTYLLRPWRTSGEPSLSHLSWQRHRHNLALKRRMLRSLFELMFFHFYSGTDVKAICHLDPFVFSNGKTDF